MYPYIVWRIEQTTGMNAVDWHDELVSEFQVVKQLCRGVFILSFTEFNYKI